MAAVKINELHKSDLPWIIEYDEEKSIVEILREDLQELRSKERS